VLAHHQVMLHAIRRKMKIAGEQTCLGSYGNFQQVRAVLLRDLTNSWHTSIAI
jgi:CII-binding regulator of phage lambda lysogenization HflD